MKLIKLNKEKSVLLAKDITYYLDPNYIYIPVDRKKICVKQSSTVYKNELITKDKLYSSISGKCIGLIKNCLVIQNDYRELSKVVRKRRGNIDLKHFIKIVEESGDFDLLRKLKSGNVVNSIVVNAINDEPYVYNKIYLLKENISEILKLMDFLGKVFKSTDCMLVVKSVNRLAIDETLNFLGMYPHIKLILVSDEYLMEEDLVLQDKLKLKTNAIFLDVHDLIKIKSILNGVNSSTHLVTISGDVLEMGKVIRVKNYTLLGDVINKFIRFKSDEFDIVVNGLMRGFMIEDYKNFVITPDILSITFMKKKKAVVHECIRCGKCKKVCPFGVDPISGKNREKCIKCGLCSYVCPSNIDVCVGIGGK